MGLFSSPLFFWFLQMSPWTQIRSTRTQSCASVNSPRAPGPAGWLFGSFHDTFCKSAILRAFLWEVLTINSALKQWHFTRALIMNVTSDSVSAQGFDWTLERLHWEWNKGRHFFPPMTSYCGGKNCLISAALKEGLQVAGGSVRISGLWRTVAEVASKRDRKVLEAPHTSDRIQKRSNDTRGTGRLEA